MDRFSDYAKFLREIDDFVLFIMRVYLTTFRFIIKFNVQLDYILMKYIINSLEYDKLKTLNGISLGFMKFI